MPLKLLVLDWDGTLADSVTKILAGKQFLAKRYNLPLPDEETVRAVLGMKFEKALSLCFPTALPTTLHEIGHEFHALMQQDSYQAELFPDVKNVLSWLHEQGIILTIATSKDRQELDKALHYHELLSLIDMSCCGKEYGEKPSPAMLYAIMEKFNVKPDECLMVGDTTIDMQFAANANIKSIAVSFGAHTTDMLQPMQPLAIIENWSQLPGVINKLCHTDFCSSSSQALSTPHL